MKHLHKVEYGSWIHTILLGYNMSCQKCNITFASKSNERRHKKKYHPEEDLDLKKNQTCSECGFKTRTLFELHSHIEQSHSDINLKFETLSFYSQKDFNDWKSRIEKETVSFYALNYTLNTSDGKINQYKCHRSGKHKGCLKTDRKRRLKSSGSVKTGITCPASMQVTTKTHEELTEITVKYQSTHTGHMLDARKLRLTKDERTGLAAVLETGVPSSIVLDKIQENYSPSQRYSLIKKQDLHNIVRDFKLPKSCLVFLTSEDVQKEKEILDDQFHKKRKIDIEDKRKSVTDTLMGLLNDLEKIDSPEDLDYISEKIKDVHLYLESKRNCTLPVPMAANNAPFNKEVMPPHSSFLSPVTVAPSYQEIPPSESLHTPVYFTFE